MSRANPATARATAKHLKGAPVVQGGAPAFPVVTACLPRLRPASSSWVRAWGYAPLTREHKARLNLKRQGFLFILTHEGNLYAYLVPSYVPAALTRASSKGRTLNRIVKGKYPCLPIEASRATIREALSRKG